MNCQIKRTVIPIGAVTMTPARKYARSRAGRLIRPGDSAPKPCAAAFSASRGCCFRSLLRQPHIQGKERRRRASATMLSHRAEQQASQAIASRSHPRNRTCRGCRKAKARARAEQSRRSRRHARRRRPRPGRLCPAIRNSSPAACKLLLCRRCFLSPGTAELQANLDYGDEGDRADAAARVLDQHDARETSAMSDGAPVSNTVTTDLPQRASCRRRTSRMPTSQTLADADTRSRRQTLPDIRPAGAQMSGS